jgi:cell division protein FtsI (penicillin-binding protein 3)
MWVIFNTRFQIFTSFFFLCYLIILFRFFYFISYFSQFSSISSAVPCAHFKFQKCVDSLGISIDPKNLTKINSSLLFFEGQENITSRRVICDNFQIPLAFDQSTYDIWIYPKLAEQNFLEISKKLGPVLKCESLAIYDFLSIQKEYTPLVFNLHPNKAQRIKTYNLPGVDILARTSRIYPYKEIVSSCIGYVNTRYNGLSGIEQSCNTILRYWKPTKQNDTSFLPVALSNLVWLQTSIDIRLQRQFSAILTQGLQNLHITRGMGIILDCYTGAIKTLSVFPQFNPYAYSTTPIEILNPWPILELYEPGSTFKPINLAIAFESSVINSQTVVVDEGCVNQFPDFDTDKQKACFFNANSFKSQFISSQPTILTLETLLARSSNIGFIHIMNRLSPFVYYKWLKYLNLNAIQPFSMNLPYENYTSFPLQYDFEKNPETILFFALGHGFSLTPFQLIQLYMSFFNQGKLISPFFIHNFILSPNLFGKKLEVTEKYSSINGTISKQIFSTRTCSFILGFLEEVLHYGTAQRGKIRNQRLAGKTGTSVFPVNGQIDQSDEPTNQRLTSFLIAYPLPSPQYLCFLLLHLNNDSIEQSATTAVPLVKALVDVLIQLVRSK